MSAAFTNKKPQDYIVDTVYPRQAVYRLQIKYPDLLLCSDAELVQNSHFFNERGPYGKRRPD